jgi:hypothetical protein
MSVKRKLVAGFCPCGESPADGLGPFRAIFDDFKNVAKEGVEGIDCLILWGGEDVHPSYYKEKKHFMNGAGLVPSSRDVFEWKAMLHCKKNKIPMIGICRGAQFLTVFAGGKLVQHVTGHGMSHWVETPSQKQFFVTSTHHQMMVPWAVPHDLIAWSNEPKSSRYENSSFSDCIEMPREPEVVYYPEIKAMAIQAHPEYAYADAPFVNWIIGEVKDRLDFKM